MVARVWPDAIPKAKCAQTVAVDSSLRTTFQMVLSNRFIMKHLHTDGNTISDFSKSPTESTLPLFCHVKSQRVGQELLLIWDRIHHQKACWRSPKPSVLVSWSVVCLILGSK